MKVELVSKISHIETIAIGSTIRDIGRFRKLDGGGRWRKLEGIDTVRLPDGSLCNAELHCYKAHVIGRKELKINHLLEE